MRPRCAALSRRLGLERPTPTYSGVTLTPVSRGGLGQVWRLDVDQPLRSFAVKELFAGGDEQRIVAEVVFRDLAVAAGIRAHEDLRTTEGRYLADADRTVVRVWTPGQRPRAAPGRSGRARVVGVDSRKAAHAREFGRLRTRSNRPASARLGHVA